MIVLDYDYALLEMKAAAVFFKNFFFKAYLLLSLIY
jgi:hypothetical protein